MNWQGKTVVIVGAAGNVGSKLTQAFSRAGAAVTLIGRTEATLRELQQSTPHATIQLADATNEAQLAAAFEAIGPVDVAINASGIPQQGIQGTGLIELGVDAFMKPILHYARTSFLIARAAAKQMRPRGGAILFHTPSPARAGTRFVGGMGPAWSAIESLTRSLSAELAERNIRVVCLRTSALRETSTIDTVYGLHAKAYGVPLEQFSNLLQQQGHRKRFTTLDELAATALFAAGEDAASLTGTTINLTGGLTPD